MRQQWRRKSSWSATAALLAVILVSPPVAAEKWSLAKRSLVMIQRSVRPVIPQHNFWRKQLAEEILWRKQLAEELGKPIEVALENAVVRAAKRDQPLSSSAMLDEFTEELVHLAKKPDQKWSFKWLEGELHIKASKQFGSGEISGGEVNVYKAAKAVLYKVVLPIAAWTETSRLLCEKKGGQLYGVCQREALGVAPDDMRNPENEVPGIPVDK
jgi:hypothetical protein